MYSTNSTQEVLWVKKDLGKVVLALLKNYQGGADEVLDQGFAVVTERVTYPEYAKILSGGTLLVLYSTLYSILTARSLDSSWKTSHLQAYRGVWLR